MLQLVVNNKTKKIYDILKVGVINSTNAQDGEEMVLYTDGDNLFVREMGEFGEKFSPVTLEEKIKVE